MSSISEAQRCTDVQVQVCSNCSKTMKPQDLVRNGIPIFGIKDGLIKTYMAPVREVISKVFCPGIELDIDPDPGPSNDPIFQLCPVCGLRLQDLYKFFQLFVDVTALGSDISNFIRKFNKNPAPGISLIPENFVPIKNCTALPRATMNKARSSPAVPIPTPKQTPILLLPKTPMIPSPMPKIVAIPGLGLIPRTHIPDKGVIVEIKDEDEPNIIINYSAPPAVEPDPLGDINSKESSTRNLVMRQQSQQKQVYMILQDPSKPFSSDPLPQGLGHPKSNPDLILKKPKILKIARAKLPVPEDSEIDPLPQQIERTEDGFTCTPCGKSVKKKADIIRHCQLVHWIPQSEAERQWNEAKVLYAQKLHAKRFEEQQEAVAMKEAARIKGQRVFRDGTKKLTKKYKKILKYSEPGKSDHCQICNMKFRYLQLYRKHMTGVHAQVFTYKCNLCDKVFNRAQSLTSHSRSHEDKGQGPFLCQFCGKLFPSEPRQRAHTKKHYPKSNPPNPRKHKCDLCTKSFANLCGLKDHKLTHKNERSFKCDQCNKGFNTSVRLRNHQEYHRAAKDRPIQCPKCPRSFPTKHSLKYHLLSAAHNCSLEEAKIGAGIQGVTRTVAALDEEKEAT